MTFEADMLSLAVDVSALIKDAGNAMTLRHTDSPSIDPVTGAVVSGPPIDSPVKGVMGKYRAEDYLTSRVLVGDFPVTFAASVSPQVGDQLIIGAKTYSLITVDRVGAADVDIVYQAQARGV